MRNGSDSFEIWGGPRFASLRAQTCRRGGFGRTRQNQFSLRSALLVLLFLLGCVPGNVLAAPWSGSAGPYNVSIEVSPATPSVGEIHLAVQAQHDGVPATDLNITVQADMPEMPSSMRDLRTPLPPTSSGGYGGAVVLPMAGTWRMRLLVRGAAGSGEAVMTLRVVGSTNGSEVCGPTGGGSSVPKVVVHTVTPPKVGDNELRIEVNDADGKPLDGVDVWTGLAMPGMAMHVAPLKAERTGPGRYQRKVRLPMAGLWVVTVDVESAVSRSSDQNGRVAATRLIRQTANLTATASPSTVSRLYPLAGAALVAGLVILGGAWWRWRSTNLLVGALCVVTALAVGEALRMHWPRDVSMGMEMDMTAPDMGLRPADMAAPVPVLVERVRRGPVVDVLNLNATVAPASEVVVGAGRAGRLSAWLVPVGAAVRRGGPLAQVVDAHGGATFTVAAPVSGVVARRRQESGELRADTPLLDLARVDEVRVQARLAVGERARLQAGTKAQIAPPEQQLEDRPAPMEARLQLVGDLVDVDTQTVAVEALVANPAMRLRPGQRVSLRIEAQRLEKVLAIPASALVSEREHRLVWVVREVAGQRLARLQVVLVGLVTADQVQIRSGLQEGDEIAVWGLERLQEGIAVTPASRGGGPYKNLLLPSSESP